MAESNPQRIGSYEILALLGDGGSGPVYHGLHSQLARPAAIKVLRDDLAQDPSVVRRFQREARIAAQLHHPNIVEIYDTGERDGFYYIARGMVDGQTLRQLLDELRPAYGETVRIARQIADALDHAHERGVIHRDLNPGGIVIDRRGQVTVIDFGIAGAIEDLIPVTGDTTTMSSWFETPAYVAPEQATGQPAVPGSDIYALGAIVYEMLTGEPPFSGTEPNELLATLLRETPPAPSERNPTLPDGTDDVVMQALAKSPTDRYPTGAAFIAELNRILGTGELQRGRFGIPPIVLASSMPESASPDAAPTSTLTATAVTEPIIIERIVYRSRRHEPAVWYGAGTTLLAIALLMNLVWGNDDGVRADIVPAATETATAQAGVIGPTMTATTAATLPAPTVAATATATIAPTLAATATVEPSPTATEAPTVAPTEPPALTATPTLPPLPSLAGGGELILFSTTRDDVPAGVLIVSPAGDVQVPAFADDAAFSNATQFALSPDAGNLAFVATPDGDDDMDIFVLDIASGELLQLTNVLGDDMMPRWSPDGTLIAFISNRDVNSEIYVMNADGSDPVNLTDDDGGDYSHAWSPDGSAIAFGSNRTGDNEVFVVNANGSNLRNLTDDPAADWGPSWSPDGSQIAFGSNRDGNDDVFIMGADGSIPRNLTDNTAADNLPVWSPMARGSRLSVTEMTRPISSS
ncbi:MAG: serine/threonine-protein kinase [Chloroflexota bacterium]|nr:serine/threonine-protein kinase [Chloroflexota bacterium]